MYKVLSQPTNPRYPEAVKSFHRSSSKPFGIICTRKRHDYKLLICMLPLRFSNRRPSLRLETRSPSCASGYWKVINWCKERSCQHCSNRQNPIASDFLICVDPPRLNHRNSLRSDKDLSKAAEYPLVTHLLDSWKNHKLGPQGPRGRIVANAVSPSRRVPSRSPLLSNDDRICRRIRVPQQLCRTRCSLMKNVMLWM